MLLHRGMLCLFGVVAVQMILGGAMIMDVTRVDELPSKIKLTVFYESYCPFSIRFILNQLYPVTMLYSDYLELDLIPFGNCKVEQETNGTYDFKCQHGEKECYGNRVHACVIDQGKTRENAKTVEVLACLMHFNYSDLEIQKCLLKSNFSIKRHKLCMIRDAVELEVAYGKRTATNEPKVHYVPFIVVNDVYNKTVESIASNNLEYVICQFLGNQKPFSCYQNNVFP